jgi:hypothetical protein
MYTFDEWGNSVLHIRTGKEGMKLLEKSGIKNTMTKEEYKKHMDSHYKLQDIRDKMVYDSLIKMLKNKNKQ